MKTPELLLGLKVTNSIAPDILCPICQERMLPPMLYPCSPNEKWYLCQEHGYYARNEFFGFDVKIVHDRRQTIELAEGFKRRKQ